MSWGSWLRDYAMALRIWLSASRGKMGNGVGSNAVWTAPVHHCSPYGCVNSVGGVAGGPIRPPQ